MKKEIKFFKEVDWIVHPLQKKDKLDYRVDVLFNDKTFSFLTSNDPKNDDYFYGDLVHWVRNSSQYEKKQFKKFVGKTNWKMFQKDISP